MELGQMEQVHLHVQHAAQDTLWYQTSPVFSVQQIRFQMLVQPRVLYVMLENTSSPILPPVISAPLGNSNLYKIKPSVMNVDSVMPIGMETSPHGLIAHCVLLESTQKQLRAQNVWIAKLASGVQPTDHHHAGNVQF
jgi:hypothetical protein